MTERPADRLPPDQQARSFGSTAWAYDRGRPTYPREAAAWLAGSEPCTVLDVGAGTGKLTEQLVALGHDVTAIDPDEDMLDLLATRAPAARRVHANAEELPMLDRSADVVVAAQSFHLFDHEQALPELARVLRPGGQLAVVWNVRDERIPWVRRLGDLIAGGDPDPGSVEALKASGLFGFVDEATFTHWHRIDADSLLDLVRSGSQFALLDPAEQEQRLAAVQAFYDDYGRGSDGMQLPYVVQCFRSVVIERPGAGHDPAPGSDGADPDLLLIDFR